MKKCVQQTIIEPLKDLRFLWIMLIFGVLVGVFDPEGLNALRIIVWVFFFWGAAYFIRSVLMPNKYENPDTGKDEDISVAELLHQAAKEPLSAAIAFAALTYLVCSIAETFTMWMR